MESDKARSFVAIMVIIAVSALALRIGIDNIIKINISQNESNAQATLKLISAALENYAKNNGIFPTNLSVLTQTNPSYLDKDYIANSPLKGYNYSCERFEPTGYKCSVIPVKCKITGTMIYTVTTGGAIISEECVKKE